MLKKKKIDLYLNISVFEKNVKKKKKLKVQFLEKLLFLNLNLLNNSILTK